MRREDMQRLAGRAPHHQCAPKEWREVTDLTGDYDLDATIEHRDNRNLPDRLNLYLRRPRGGAYGPLTGYNGYHGYGGDN